MEKGIRSSFGEFEANRKENRKNDNSLLFLRR